VDELPRFRRALFLSCTYPTDFEKAVYGLYHRMRTFLQAVSEVTESLDILCISDRIDGDVQAATRELSARLERDWGIRAELFLVQAPGVASGLRWTDHYLRPALSLRHNPDYAGLETDAVLLAVNERLARKPDFVFAHRLQATLPLLSLPGRPEAPLYFDLDDVEHRKLVRSLFLPPHYPGKLPYALRALPVMLGERRAARAAARTFVCSEADRAYLEKLGYPRVAVIQNSIGIPAEAPPLRATRQLVFLGAYTYAPNIAGAEFLITKVWPLVRAAAPDAQLVIAGNRSDRIQNFAHPPAGVRFVGFVDDLPRLYGDAQVVCCPIQSGGGTRIKIIEAAAHARPVVSTTIGAEGLQFQDEREILIADAPAQFARACIRLLEDLPLATRLGTMARERAQALYSRASAIESIKREIFAGIAEQADVTLQAAPRSPPRHPSR
jgi:glycosyltransferase involved in cell wall biosynthesis